MKKLFITILLFTALTLYSFLYGKTNQESSQTALPPAVTTQATSSSAGSTPATTVSSQPTGTYKDGTYTGTSVDAYYGNVQVQIVVQSGKIITVNVLDYPQSHEESIAINSNALPTLKQETITAQSATIDSVSRATFTSDAFKQSLAAAISQAQ